jgi:Ribbon-helix-helix protein, copG family
MRKTSVYLTDEEAEGLRRVAMATGKSQAELIREGVRHVIDTEGGAARQFRSLGKGRGGGEPYTSWNPEELYTKVMGRE